MVSSSPLVCACRGVAQFGCKVLLAVPLDRDGGRGRRYHSPLPWTILDRSDPWCQSLVDPFAWENV